MAYSKQTFTFEQVLTSSEMNQVEDNISDHIHGRDSVLRTGISFPRTAKSAGFTVGTDEAGELFACTGTFTVTFPSATAVSPGWAVTVDNVGSGSITIDPDGSETVNGLSTLTIGPGQFAFIYSDGSNLIARGMGAGITVQTFTSSGTWNNPGCTFAIPFVVGGGGGGGGSTGAQAGARGGDGGVAIDAIDVSGISDETITVGGGGNGSASGTGSDNTGLGVQRGERQ